MIPFCDGDRVGVAAALAAVARAVVGAPPAAERGAVELVGGREHPAAGGGRLRAVARSRRGPHRAPRRGRPGSGGLGGGAGVAATAGLVLGSGACVGAAYGAAGAAVATGADWSASTGGWGERTVVRTSVATSITTAPTATGASRRMPRAAARARVLADDGGRPTGMPALPERPHRGDSCSADRSGDQRHGRLGRRLRADPPRRHGSVAWGETVSRDDGGRSSNLRGVVARARPQVGPARQVAPDLRGRTPFGPMCFSAHGERSWPEG